MSEPKTHLASSLDPRAKVYLASDVEKNTRPVPKLPEHFYTVVLKKGGSRETTALRGPSFAATLHEDCRGTPYVGIHRDNGGDPHTIELDTAKAILAFLQGAR